MKDYHRIAQEIIQVVGKDNILSATHCATRLRFMVKDRDAINDKKVEAIEEVKGVFFTSGQYQIILGTGIVNKVYAELETIGLHTVSKKEQEEAVKNQEKGIKKLMRILADIFVPIIPVIAATGLFLGLKGCIFNDNVLALFGADTTQIPTYIQTLVTVLTDTAFAFLPAIITWSAFRVFHGTPVIGLVIGLMLVAPALPNAYAVADPNSGVEAIMAFGFIPLVGCQGSVLTAIVTGWFGATLEKKLRKIMPNVLDLIFTPFFVMLITMLVILLGVGPIMHTIELGMVGIIENLIHLPFGIGGFIIGFTYPLAVITGLHHTYVMIETSLLANTGFNPLITLCAMYGFANVGTCLAFFVKAKKQNIKQTSIGAMLSQLFGISEPVLFGIQLRFNLKPLCIMLFSSGIGAALLSIMNIQSNSYGLAVLPSYLMYIYEGHQLIWYFLISLFSTILCFVLTCLFGIPQEVMVEDTIAEENAYFIAPASGTFVPLENVPDETFAKKMLGDGFAIDLQDEFIISPVAGEVVTAFPDGHAFGIKGKDGMEILIHIGINTVDLQESCFTPLVSLKESVKQGQPIVKVDLKKLKESGKSGMTMIIFTNKDKLQIEAANQITAGNKMHLSFS
ncbi:MULTISPECIES: PTS beta-glucoside transporter subunit IIBCA [Bacillota]|jgi:PTS system sucrose-specific IIC component|uniref:PTS glucose transporter subunit IIA n=2 Tax=Amedibacillus TaxID=2749846 RepID=A0A7G9GP13_9FIRM|nr:MULTISPECIES: PTS transporter subunit IIBCA [Bacillota]QNM12545.1 PTS glucose transporter subunit IIA [[Eubacterium] hominis]MCH4284146.1 glucose PTS transporter subunit IIA [Amedibacillus hominis]RGB57599.1 PTS beta-glucoside transporter subunit IIBCA [Absiella sp. AM22-9]RGB62295.1 PTS beta-glucoside transporter subunit IIBCA [Absiella sp. AM10-20]RGB67697.1 PTS beta-glucoside transporter subunit IIBCA [Absiella sp. AM09-45]